MMTSVLFRARSAVTGATALLGACAGLLPAPGLAGTPEPGEGPDRRAWQVAADGPLQSVSDRFGAAPLTYQVSWSELTLDPEDGPASATISATAYLSVCGCDLAQRPVMFLFNGGPGASSSPLHFAKGPRARTPGGSFPENPYTVLRAADLVFIDPVDTGFSRANSPTGEARYLGVEGDVDAVHRFIREWLERSGRTGSPLFLVGQSYGASRLANLTGKIGDLDVRGLVMVSPALDSAAGETDLAHVFALPTMAAAAWRLGRSSIEATDEAESWARAAEFAETDYLLALQKGDLIGAADKARIAAQIAAMTGLSTGAVLEANLRVSKQYFLETLLAEEGLLISRLNTARTSEVAGRVVSPERPAAANDPSLGLGLTNIRLAGDIAAYLATVTGLSRGIDYRSLNLDANFAWDWREATKAPRFYVSAAPVLARYMAAQQEVRLLVFAGSRDLATPLLATRYVLTHNDLPQERVRLIALPAGHSPYDEDELKAGIADELYAFLSGATAPLRPVPEETLQ